MVPGGRAEVEGQWAYVAVLGEKGHTKESSNGRPYAMWCAPHPGSGGTVYMSSQLGSAAA